MACRHGFFYFEIIFVWLMGYKVPRWQHTCVKGRTHLGSTYQPRGKMPRVMTCGNTLFTFYFLCKGIAQLGFHYKNLNAKRIKNELGFLCFSLHQHFDPPFSLVASVSNAKKLTFQLAMATDPCFESNKLKPSIYL